MSARCGGGGRIIASAGRDLAGCPRIQIDGCARRGINRRRKGSNVRSHIHARGQRGGGGGGGGRGDLGEHQIYRRGFVNGQGAINGTLEAGNGGGDPAKISLAALGTASATACAISLYALGATAQTASTILPANFGAAAAAVLASAGACFGSKLAAVAAATAAASGVRAEMAPTMAHAAAGLIPIPDLITSTAVGTCDFESAAATSVAALPGSSACGTDFKMLNEGLGAGFAAWLDKPDSNNAPTASDKMTFSVFMGCS